ncbi:cation-translocating P-type ATPase [Patescibacteria group bacterium]
MNSGKSIEWHSLPQKEILFRFKTHPEQGLSDTEAEKRRKKYGSNILETKKKWRLFRIFFEQLKSPLVIVLIIAGIVSLVLKEFTDAIVIYLAVFINTVVGFIQEGKARKTFEKLRETIEKKALVIRDGLKKEITARELVPGDLVVLEAGTGVPADLRLITSKSLSVNEAALTGEWMPIEKMPGVFPVHVGIPKRKNMLFMGTTIEEGRGRAIVVSTSKNTELGKIAALVEEVLEPPTPFQRKIISLSRVLGMVIMISVIAIFILGLFREQDIAQMFLTSVAVAVATIPEGLPVVVTVVLAIGMERILRKKGLVKQLKGAETLGSTTVILTDKTGTLTEGKMDVSHLITAEDLLVRDSKFMKKIRAGNAENAMLLLTIGVASSSGFVENPEAPFEEWIIRGRAFDRAFLKAGLHANIIQKDVFKQLPRVDIFPFDSELRFSGSIHKKSQKKYMLYILGAPESILERSSKLKKSSKSIPLRNQETGRLVKTYEKIIAKGTRILGVASKELTEKEMMNLDIKTIKNMTLIGFIGFHDPIRKGVKEAIEDTKRAGIRTVMVTGDHKLTAKAVADELGIASGEILDGEELELLKPVALQEKINKVSIFTRILPHQKSLIAAAFQKQDDVVAMTGDGVNDAPALKRADIGVALESGTEVAKEAADFILLDDSFKIIADAVKEGRVIFDNLRKSVTFLLASSFSSLILIAGTLILGFPLPILPAQILWTNLVEGGFLNFALVLEPGEKDVLATKPRKRSASLFTREMKFIIFIIGIFTDLLLLSLFFILWYSHVSIDVIRTVMFGGLTIDSIFFIFALRSLRKPAWKMPFFRNPYLFFSTIFSFTLLMLAIYTPALRNLLSLTPIGFGYIMLILLLGFIDFILIEASKYYFILRKKVS